MMVEKLFPKNIIISFEEHNQHTFFRLEPTTYDNKPAQLELFFLK